MCACVCACLCVCVPTSVCVPTPVCVPNWVGTGLGVCGGVQSLRRLYFASAVPLLRLWKLVTPTLTTLSSTSHHPICFLPDLEAGAEG